MELPEKFDQIVSLVLTTGDGPLDDTASPETVEGWDSVTHVILLTALEDEFKITFLEKEMDSLDTIGDIRRKVAEKLEQKTRT